jgi:predicted PurR-regulated permease PerM
VRAGRVTRTARERTAPVQPASTPPLTRRSPFGLGFLGAVGVLLAFWLGQQLLSIGSILVLIVVSMFLAAGLNPAVEWMERRGLRRSLAVLVVVLVVVAAVALFLVALVPVIADQVALLVNNVPKWISQLQHNHTVQRLDQRYNVLDRAREIATKRGLATSVFGGLVGVGLKLLTFLGNTFVVVVLTLYFLATLPRVKRSVYRFAPASRQQRVAHLGDQIVENVGSYVSGAFIVAMAAGISSLIFMFAVGLGQYAIALAAVVTVLDVIPLIGATLGAIIVTLIGFATAPHIGLFCIVFYLLYQQLENYVIYPRVMRRVGDLPGSIIVIAALIGASLLGVIGALLAIPAAAAIVLIVNEVVLPRQTVR